MASDLCRQIVIGIGNPERGDDGAGRLVAARLAGALPENIEVAELDGEVTALLARLKGKSNAILVDACVSGAPAGTVQRFDAVADPLPGSLFGVSSHGLGLAEAVELARALGDLPPSCIVYAIEGVNFEPGEPVSQSVVAAVERLATHLRTELTPLGRSAEFESCTKPH